MNEYNKLRMIIVICNSIFITAFLISHNDIDGAGEIEEGNDDEIEVINYTEFESIFRMTPNFYVEAVFIRNKSDNSTICYFGIKTPLRVLVTYNLSCIRENGTVDAVVGITSSTIIVFINYNYTSFVFVDVPAMFTVIMDTEYRAKRQRPVLDMLAEKIKDS